MTKKTCLAALLALFLLASPAAAQMTKEQAMKLAQQYQGQIGGAPTELQEPIELTPEDIRAFIKTVSGLHEIGVEAELEGRDGDVRQMAAALAASEKAQRMLASHDFTVDRFSRVTYAIGLALAKIDGNLDDAKLDEAKAAQAKMMAQLKDRLTQEQIDAMAGSLGAADTYMDLIRNQPARNPELVRLHIEDLRKVLERRQRN